LGSNLSRAYVFSRVSNDESLATRTHSHTESLFSRSL
jgi:hypothetical protein